MEVADDKLFPFVAWDVDILAGLYQSKGGSTHPPPAQI